jgi:hypothetical protein
MAELGERPMIQRPTSELFKKKTDDNVDLNNSHKQKIVSDILEGSF